MLAIAAVATSGVPAVLAAPPSAYPRPGVIDRVSVATDGTQANNPPGCFRPFAVAGMDVSADGRYVVFASSATNLVPLGSGAPAAGCQVYWRDRVARVTKLVSAGVHGLPGLGQSGMPSINADGRFVAYVSNAANLVPGDTNVALDVFVRDMRSSTTVRASVTSSGAQTGGPGLFSGARQPSISSDGRRVAFHSDASTLVPGDTNNADDVFVRDLAARKTMRVSVASGGGQVQGHSDSPFISGDGRFVAFASGAQGLTSDPPAPVGSGTSIYRHDLRTRQTQLVSVSTSGERAQAVVQGAGSALVSYGGRSISDNGRFIVFWTSATNLVPNDSNYLPLIAGWDVFVRDMQARRTERISVSSSGEQFADTSEWPSISGDGRFVEYNHTFSGPTECPAWSLLGVIPVSAGVPGVGCGRDVYVYDRLAGSTENVSRPLGAVAPKPGMCSATDPSPSRNAMAGAISRDGRIASFWSSDAALVAGDSNDSCDYFVRDRGNPLGAGALTGGASASSASGSLVPGARLVGSRVVPRSTLGDLYVRWDVERLSLTQRGIDQGVLYGMSFTTGGSRYQVRAQRIPGPDYDTAGGASFGLFRQDATTGQYLKVATLKGGFGTIGESVVVAVPLAELGLADGRELTDVTAFTALGTYASGATQLLDTIRLVP